MFFILIPNIPVSPLNDVKLFPAFYAFAPPLMILGTPDAPIPHPSSVPLALDISPDITRLVLAQYHGHVNYAFWVRRKPQKSFAHLT